MSVFSLKIDIADNKFFNGETSPLFSQSQAKLARQFHQKIAGYRPTPLCALDDLANLFGVKKILVKDESKRFGLNAFKMLGGAYAIAQLLCEKYHLDIETLSFEHLKNAIGEKMGTKVEVKSLGFDALIPALRSGQIDMIASGMDATPERQKQVSFTEPYFQDGYSVVVRKDNTNINGFDDLKGRTVGSQVGTKGVDLATEAGATVKQYDANSQGWMELQSGTCDAVVINTSVALYYMKEGGDKDLKIVGDAKKADAGIAMAVSKDKPELLEKVNKALADLKADGTYAKLYKKWFGVDPKA